MAETIIIQKSIFLLCWRCIIGINILLWDFSDDREKGEDLSSWKSTKGNASWKFISFKGTRELHKQIRQQELHGEQTTEQHIINGNFDELSRHTQRIMKLN